MCKRVCFQCGDGSLTTHYILNAENIIHQNRHSEVTTQVIWKLYFCITDNVSISKRQKKSKIS